MQFFLLFLNWLSLFGDEGSRLDPLGANGDEGHGADPLG